MLDDKRQEKLKKAINDFFAQRDLITFEKMKALFEELNIYFFEMYGAEMTIGLIHIKDKKFLGILKNSVIDRQDSVLKRIITKLEKSFFSERIKIGAKDYIILSIVRKRVLSSKKGLTKKRLDKIFHIF